VDNRRPGDVPTVPPDVGMILAPLARLLVALSDGAPPEPDERQRQEPAAEKSPSSSPVRLYRGA
jgi:hypothetical protein